MTRTVHCTNCGHKQRLNKKLNRFKEDKTGRLCTKQCPRCEPKLQQKHFPDETREQIIQEFITIP